MKNADRVTLINTALDAARANVERVAALVADLPPVYHKAGLLAAHDCLRAVQDLELVRKHVQPLPRDRSGEPAYRAKYGPKLTFRNK